MVTTMFTSIDFCAQNSKLNYIKAQYKVLLAVVFIVATISLSNLIFMTAVIVFTAVITIFIGKTKGEIYFKLLRIPLTFILLSTVVLLFEYSKDLEGIFKIGSFVVTDYTLNRAILLTVRALAGVSVLYTLCLSTPIYEIFGVLRKIKVPSIIIELMYLIYRYIFILSQSMEGMKIAANLRMGFDSGSSSIKTAGGIMINLFILSLKKASKSFDAMEARCYDGDIPFGRD